MLKVDPSVASITVPPEWIVTLLKSVNAPLINIPGSGTGSTVAHVVGVAVGPATFRIYVHLRQTDNGDAYVVYVSDPQDLTAEQYRVEEAEALRFLETMGFALEDTRFQQLPPDAQVGLMRQAGFFGFTPGAVPPQAGETSPGGFAAAPPPPPEVSYAPPPGAPPLEISRGEPLPGAAVGSEWMVDLAEGPPAVMESPARRGGGEDRDPESLARLGRLLSTFGLLAALSPLAQGCATMPDASEPVPPAQLTQIDIGNQELGHEKWSAAVTTFTQVLEVAPQAKNAHYGIALAYIRLRRDDLAEGHLRQAMKLDPKWSIPKNALASILIRTRRCEEAEEVLRATLGDIFYTTPEFAEHNLARALECQGRGPEAVEQLESLLVRRPKFCLGYLTLAQISSDEKMPERTIKSCEGFAKQCEAHEEIAKLVTADQSCSCLHKKGIAYAEMGDVSSARSAFSNCRGDSPSCRECYRSLELLTQQ